MAKRNIARTAIEGGRNKSNRFHEHQEDVSERQMYRNYCREVISDPETDEPSGWKAKHSTGRSYREFDDKLQPVMRWLNSQIGRRWDDVFSEISERFDKRTLAGRHIDHIHGWVNIDRVPPTYHKSVTYGEPWDPAHPTKTRTVKSVEWIEFDRWVFNIDAKGILVCGKQSPYSRKKYCND